MQIVKMRLKYSKLLTLIVFVINAILLYYTWKLFLTDKNSETLGFDGPSVTAKAIRQKDRIQSTNRHIKKAITIVFRDFYHFENDLQHSIDSILNLIPNVQIVVVYDTEPYPPMAFIANYSAIHSNVKFINLSFDVKKTARALSPVFQMKTKYALFLPDAVRLGGRTIVQKMLKEIEKVDVSMTDREKSKISEGSGGAGGGVSTSSKSIIRKIVVIPFASNVKTMGNCCRIKMDLANWTMEYSVKNGTDNCDMFIQKHAILVDVAFLRTMPSPLAAPFPEMFYVQAKMGKSKQVLLNGVFQDGKRLFTAYHNKQRKKEMRKQQFKEMYKKLNVKKIIRKFAGKTQAKIEKFRKNRGGDGKSMLPNNILPPDDSRIVLSNTSLPLLTTIEYYGCEKNTKSCVGIVYDRKPFYYYLDRNTPPCCLEKLKLVFFHLLEEFENVGIRYWLDNYALKNAVESNQLANDAYEIDVSFNAFDLERSAFLKKAQTRPLADASGFYWIKATDGHYFRVQFSKQNQIGVNLLPFDINGDRVVPNGFYGWKAKEFSGEFLHPMSTVLFLNKNVMCPNNVREFLEKKNVH